MWRPPNIDRQSLCPVTQRRHGLREFGDFGDIDNSGVEALLCGLGPEGGEIWWHDHTGDNLNSSSFEGRDLGRKVIRHRLEPTGINQLIAFLNHHRGKAELGIPPSVPIRIVRP